jgi:hypothetical protein
LKGLKSKKIRRDYDSKQQSQANRIHKCKKSSLIRAIHGHNNSASQKDSRIHCFTKFPDVLPTKIAVYAGVESKSSLPANEAHDTSSDSVTFIGSSKPTTCTDYSAREKDSLVSLDQRDHGHIFEMGTSIKQLVGTAVNDREISDSLRSSAAKKEKDDVILDRLNSQLRTLEQDEIGNLTETYNDPYLSPARLHTFGLSYGAEVLKGIEKARQEMIQEMEAQERKMQDNSDSTAQEPTKEEDPAAWKRWQDAKKLLRKVREREQKIMGVDRDDEDHSPTLDQELNETAQTTFETEIDSDAELRNHQNFTGVFNMTFENLAAGLLELVRRRSGLNSSADLLREEDQIDDSSETSSTDNLDANDDSDVVVERNEEEGVTRWIDARDRITNLATPSWKRIGRGKRISRAEKDHSGQLNNDVIDCLQNLFPSQDILHAAENEAEGTSSCLPEGGSAVHDAQALAASESIAVPTCHLADMTKDQIIDSPALGNTSISSESQADELYHSEKKDIVHTPTQVIILFEYILYRP